MSRTTIHLLTVSLHNARPLTTYLDRYGTYKLTQVRERKDTDIYKTVMSINESVESLKGKMYEASDIEIRVTFGLTKIMASAKAKEAERRTFETNLDRIIKSTNINNKLQK